MGRVSPYRSRDPVCDIRSYHILILTFPSLLRHPNVPLLMAVSCGTTGPDLCLVFEPLSTFSLHHQLHHQHKKHSLLARMKIMTGVASGKVLTHNNG